MLNFSSLLNMDGLENSSQGSRGHANIGQASLNFDCTKERERRKKGQEKKFRFMNEIRQKNGCPLAQNYPPFKVARSESNPDTILLGEEGDLQRPSADCRYLAFLSSISFSRDISPINNRYDHISKLISGVERFPEVRKLFLSFRQILNPTK